MDARRISQAAFRRAACEPKGFNKIALRFRLLDTLPTHALSFGLIATHRRRSRNIW
jgi:hypothetical protein